MRVIKRTGSWFLARWAGNEAAHEEGFSEAAVVHLDSLVEQLVVYLFTVPEIQAQFAPKSLSGARQAR